MSGADAAPPVDLDQVGTEVSEVVDADPAVVWDLVTDLERTPSWNRETVEARWREPAAGPVLAAVFVATNQLGAQRWEVSCHVVECERPWAFGWTVLDPARPSSTWWYRIRPEPGGGVRVDHGFQLGPGPSGLRSRVDADPAAATAIIEGRTAMLAANMTFTLRCIKAVAEDRPPDLPGT